MNSAMDCKCEIFSQRLITAVFWNIWLQVLLSALLVLVIQVDPLHPVSWAMSTFGDIFSLKMTFNIVMLTLVSVFQATIYSRYHLAAPPTYFTRFSLFLNMFTLQNVVFCLLYALSGYFTMSLYSSLANKEFYTLRKICEHYDGQCLKEDSLFLQLGGLWVGLYYFITRHIFGTAILSFPHVHQDKYQKIKLAVGNIIVMGVHSAITPGIYYCIFYYIWGNKPRSVVSDVYSLYLEDAPLDNVFNLVGSGIWISLWFYMGLFFISINMMRYVFDLVITEPMQFPIESEKKLTLHAALEQKAQFNGVLGAQDLRLLSMTDPARRMIIFSLSQPGGHPRNWNNVIEKCLRIINDFSKELESLNNNDTRPETTQSPSKSAYNSNLSNIRNMALSPEFQALKNPSLRVPDTLMDNAKAEFQLFLQKLSKKPGISYFFGELTNTKLKFLLIQSQSVTWTCEGLAHLAAASLKEDKYGIVQNDLPVIISSLINLKQNLEKINKLGLVQRKQILNDNVAIKMKSALLSSVKRSIYKIIITFHRYINDIPLSPEVKMAIQPFLLCKEG